MLTTKKECYILVLTTKRYTKQDKIKPERGRYYGKHENGIGNERELWGIGG